MTNNGVVLPDLTWKPVAHELKQAYCPLIIEKPKSYGSRSGPVPENRFIVRRITRLLGDENSGDLDCTAIIREDGIVIDRKPVKLPFVPAGGEEPFTFDPALKKKPGREYTLTFSLGQKKKTFYAPKGREAGAYQFLLEKTAGPPPSPSAKACGAVSVNESAGTYRVELLRKETGADIRAELNRNTGLMSGLEKNGSLCIASGFKPTFKRPLTGLDCRKDWGWYNEYARIRNLEPVIVSSRVLSGEKGAGIEFEFIMGGNGDEPRANGTLAYFFCADGTIEISYTIHIDRSLEAIPRAGLEMILPGGFEHIQYYGYGPVENYPDRMLSAILAVHTSTVEAQHFPFVPPSENGGHGGTRWVCFSGKDRGEIRIGSQQPFHFDAHHNSADDYIAAAHDHELIRRAETFVHIDAAHGPIGSEMAWSTVMPSAHALGGGSYHLRFTVDLAGS